MYALIDFDNDGTADSIVTVIANLTAPTGLAYANGSLWVATTPTIYRYDGVDALARAGKVGLPLCCYFLTKSICVLNLTGLCYTVQLGHDR